MQSFSSLFLGLLCLVSFQAIGDEGDSPRPVLRSEPQQRILEMEIPYRFDGTLVLRVGSPLFNMIKNDIRLARDSGEELTADEQAILRIDEINLNTNIRVSGVGPNSLLLFKKTEPESGIFLVCSYPGRDIQIGDPFFWQRVGGVLFWTGAAWIEVIIEDGLYSGVLPLEYSTRQPILEIMNSFQSDSSLLERFENSGVAIFDAASGIAYAGADIWGQLSEFEIARAVKALLRIPFSGVQLGGTVAMKVLRLPFDLAVTGIQNLIELFSDSSESQTGITSAPSLHDEVRRRIIENNDYELDVESEDRFVSVYYSSEYGMPEKTRFGEGTFQFLDILHNQYTGEENELSRQIVFQWTAVHDDETDFFVARVTSREPGYEARNFILMGTIDGTFDIDIEGVIVRNDMTIPDVLSRGPRAKTLREFRRQAIGTFHFDDL